MQSNVRAKRKDFGITLRAHFTTYKLVECRQKGWKHNLL
jgi:hypothetical protein